MSTLPDQDRPSDELIPFSPASADSIGDEPADMIEDAPDDARSDDDAFAASLEGDAETRALIDRAHDGDVEALNELFSRYHGFMVEMARRRLGAKLKRKEDADDLAQTTFREATRDFGRYEYRGEGSLLRWLLQILHNKIRDKAEYYGAGKRDMTRERTIDAPPDEDKPAFREPAAHDLSVTRVVQRNEEVEILREALADLSPDHRKAITLVFFQGLPLRKAGELMGGRTEDAVRMMLRRAENRLRELTAARLQK